MKGTLKSQGSIMLGLTNGMLDDLKRLHDCPPRHFDRDKVTLTKRTKAEGPQFLTKTLPLLGKALDAYLAGNPFVVPTNFKVHRRTKLPLLFHGLFESVVVGSRVGQEADIAAIKSLRQLCYLFYKYELPYDHALVASKIRDFFALDESLGEVVPDVEAMSTIYYAKEVLREIFETFTFTDFHAKNGPGSVANGLSPWERFRPSRFYKSLDDLYPYHHCFYYNDRHLFDSFAEYFDCDHGNFGTAKLLAVPKDSRGPRLISSEQSEFMTYQQAMKGALTAHLESTYPTRGHVNFTDQSINGQLALESSSTQQNATLDLSEASDRLSMWLVDLLFEDTQISEWLKKSRSTYTSYKGIRHRLRKFAPMGSALCFPIQAVSFYSLIVGALIRDGVPRRAAHAAVYVYGDDIVVPTQHVACAIQALTSVGLKINEGKSCTSGFFRESCGVDAFNGVDVTPTKAKRIWSDKPSVKDIASWCALADNLFANAYWVTADVIRSMLERVMRITLKTPTSPIVGLTTWSHDHAVEANAKRLVYSRKRQCWAIRAICLKARVDQPPITGWERMVRIAWETRTSVSSFDSNPFCSGQFTSRDRVNKHYRVVYGSSF